MEVFKSEGTDLFRQMANETGNKQIEKVAFGESLQNATHAWVVPF